jgi:hypothetical protein
LFWINNIKDVFLLLVRKKRKSSHFGTCLNEFETNFFFIFDFPTMFESLCPSSFLARANSTISLERVWDLNGSVHDPKDITFRHHILKKECKSLFLFLRFRFILFIIFLFFFLLCSFRCFWFCFFLRLLRRKLFYFLFFLVFSFGFDLDDITGVRLLFKLHEEIAHHFFVLLEEIVFCLFQFSAFDIILLLLIFFDEILDFWCSFFDLINWDCCDLLILTQKADCWKQTISFQVFRNICRFRFDSIAKKANLLLLSVVADSENDDDFFCCFGA